MVVSPIDLPEVECRVMLRRLQPASLLLLAFFAIAARASAQHPAAPASSPQKLSSAEVKQKSQEAVKLLNETVRLRDAGKFDEAIVPGKKYLDILRQVYSSDSQSVLEPMVMVAAIYQSNGDFANAELLRREILAKTQKLYPAGNWHVTNARLGLQDTLFVKNLDPAKRRELADAEQIRRQSKELARKGKFADALPQATRASDTIKRIDSGSSRRYVASVLTLATIYGDIGDYRKAALLGQQAVNLDRSLVGLNHPDYAVCAGNLAETYRQMGVPSRALVLEIDATNVYRNTLGPRDPLYAVSLNNLGSLYFVMGDYTSAEPLLRQALSIFQSELGEKNEKYASCLSNLAGLYMALRDFRKGEAFYKHTLLIEKELFGESNPTYATTLCNLGLLYENEGVYAKAEPVCRQACEIGKRTVGENHPTYARFLFALGRADYGLWKFSEAEQVLKQNVAIQQKTFSVKPFEYADALDVLALAEAALGHYDDALQAAHQSLRSARILLNQSASVGSERRQLAMEALVRFVLNTYLSMTPAAKVPANMVYGEVLYWKGSVTATQEAMRRTRDIFQKTRHKSSRAMSIDQLADTSRALANESMRVSRPGTEAAHQYKLAELNDRVETLQRQVEDDMKYLPGGHLQKPIYPDDIRHALPPDAALVDFLEYNRWSQPIKGASNNWEPRVVAFVVRPGKAVDRIEVCSQYDINDRIAAWRKGFGAPGRDGSDPGRALRRLVWDKIEPSLEGAQTILISPDGSTAQLPFAALPGKKPGTYLIEERAIAIVPIPRLLPELVAAPHSAPSGPDSLMVVGGVDFGGDPGKATQLAVNRGGNLSDAVQWPSLPGTVAEISAVAAAYDKDHPKDSLLELTGAAATKNAVLAGIPKSRYLHFATHGYFAPQQANSAGAAASFSLDNLGAMESKQGVRDQQVDLLCGLVLAGANRVAAEGEDSGIMTALEVSELDLRHVELATLSACETGLGTSVGGEGVLGLQRAFQVAGAKSVVASLWKVSDKATELLMARFYNNLWQKKMSKLAALREAQLWMLHEGQKQPGMSRGLELPDEETQRAATSATSLSPYFWAAFVLSGDWR